MILNKAIVKKKANIHSRYRCPRQHVLFRFSVVIFSGGPMILNKAIVKIKSLYSQQVSLSNDNIIFFRFSLLIFFFRRSYIFFLGVCLLFNIFLLFDSNKLFD